MAFDNDLFEIGDLDISDKVASFSNRVKQGLTTVKEATLTPIDSSLSKMKEGVAFKSNKEVGLTKTLTSFKSETIGELNGVVKGLSGGLLNLRGITKAIRIDENGIRLDQDSIISAVSSSFGLSVGGKSGLMQTIASDISNEFRRITGINVPNLINANGGKFNIRGNWRGELGKSTLNQLSKLVGLDDLLDTSARAAVINSLLYKTSLFGMRDAYSSIYGSYPAGMEWYRRDAVLEAMREVIAAGDILSLETLLNLLNTSDRTVLLGKYPDFIERLFSNFNFDNDVTPDDYPVLSQKLFALLDGLMGERWWMKHTEFGECLNLALVAKVSEDARVLLLLNDEIAPLVCAAGLFRDEKADVVLRSSFPKAPYFD